MEMASPEHNEVVADLINLKAEASSFKKCTFEDIVRTTVQPIDWW